MCVCECVHVCDVTSECACAHLCLSVQENKLKTKEQMAEMEEELAAAAEELRRRQQVEESGVKKTVK